MWFSECLPVDPRFFSAFWSSLCCIFSGYRPVVPLGRWPVGPLARGRHGGDRGVLRNFGGRAGDAKTGGLGAGFTERCDAL